MELCNKVLSKIVEQIFSRIILFYFVSQYLILSSYSHVANQILEQVHLLISHLQEKDLRKVCMNSHIKVE